MAKRKRKMTLFDVINTGPAKGLQVRHRVPTYQPVPELPVQKKLAKLFRRRGGQPDRPLTAAEELEALRRELSPGTASPAATHLSEPEPIAESIQKKPVPRVTTRVVEYEPTPQEAPREAAPAMSVADRVRMLAGEVDDAERDRPARSNGIPLGTRALRAWNRFTPHLANAGRGAGRGVSGGFIHLRSSLSNFREYQSRYGVTVVTAVAFVVLLGGSFMVGKTLLSGPAQQPPLLAKQSTDVRRDVLDFTTPANANLNSAKPQATLVDRPAVVDPAKANAPISLAFKGRDLSLNYVIIQSCATEADAKNTVEVLARYNVAATVETGLDWFNSKLLYKVVSTVGFAKVSANPDHARFMENLQRISDREAGNSIRDRLDPHALKLVQKKS